MIKSFTVLKVYDSKPALCRIKCNICGREKIAHLFDVYAFAKNHKLRPSIACPCLKTPTRSWIENNVVGKICGTRMKCLRVLKKESEPVYVFKCEKCGEILTVRQYLLVRKKHVVTCPICENTEREEEKMKNSIWRLIRRERVENDFVKKGKFNPYKFNLFVYACKNCGKKKTRKYGGIQRLPQKCPRCGFCADK